MDASEGPTLTAIRRDALSVPNLRVAVSTGSEQIEVPLGVKPVVVGTSGECDLVLRDPQISRRHCRVTLTERGVVLEDLGSKNGTFVREVPVREVILLPGVAATLGACKLAVAVVGAPLTLPLSKLPRFGEALGGSVVMRALFATLQRAAATDATVVLIGESGTGKELLARAIHTASPRSAGPLEVLDCSAVAPTLLEAELFGHVRGAFTGATANRAGVLERAEGGTLFVDELGELPLELQPKLLRAVETRQLRRLGSNSFRPFDVRLVVATHRDLRAEVTAGTFRQDLFYRLAMVEARVPPLRERKDDIPLLVERLCGEQDPPRALADLPPNTLALLMAHDWPGNVRELFNTVRRLLLFPEMGSEAIEGSSRMEGAEAPRNLPLREARSMVVEQFERAYIAAALRKHGGKVARAAEALGISRQLLYRMLEQYGLPRDDRGSS